MSEILEARNVALVFDIHGNQAALEAVLDDISARSDIDMIVFGGDYALNGPEPGACIDRVMAMEYPAIIGNTDEYLTTKYDAHADDPVVEWTRGELEKHHLEWLAERPFDVSVAPPGARDDPESHLHVVHANPVDTERPLLLERHPYSEWGRTPDEEAAEMLAQERAQVTVFGHIHCPMAGRLGGHRVRAVGSVGFPWDGNPKAAYGLARWNGNGWTLQDIRVSYDTDAVIEALQQSGMPRADARVESLEDASFAPLADPGGEAEAEEDSEKAG